MIWIRFKCAWWLAKEDVAMHKFGSLVELQLSTFSYNPNVYCDDTAGWELVTLITRELRWLLAIQVSESPFYGIMVDETTDQSTTAQLILYVKFLERNSYRDLVVSIQYLDLVHPDSASAADITVYIHLF